MTTFFLGGGDSAVTASPPQAGGRETARNAAATDKVQISPAAVAAAELVWLRPLNGSTATLVPSCAARLDPPVQTARPVQETCQDAAEAEIPRIVRQFGGCVSSNLQFGF